jgi:hypothetical protein
MRARPACATWHRQTWVWAASTGSSPEARRGANPVLAFSGLSCFTGFPMLSDQSHPSATQLEAFNEAMG